MISTVWRYTQPLSPRAYIVWSQPCKLIWAESFLHPCGAPQPSKAVRASCVIFLYGKWQASFGCREPLPSNLFWFPPLAVELYPNLSKSNISWNFGPLFTPLQLKRCAPSMESKETVPCKSLPSPALCFLRSRNCRHAYGEVWGISQESSQCAMVCETGITLRRAREYRQAH